MSDFSKDCTDCGACVDACPFMKEYGTPRKIAEEKPEKVFFCTSCRRCEASCPLDLSPAVFFLEAKEKLIRENQMPIEVQKSINGARAFAKAGHGFPFSFYAKTET
ncbi:MAG TPA: 4Fe-4S dicluster domain-containing protein, partial [Smithella sp.]|nr:4Fe-4S dicluster domain-containing protein [Smithella sp.]